LKILKKISSKFAVNYTQNLSSTVIENISCPGTIDILQNKKNEIGGAFISEIIEVQWKTLRAIPAC
jgi:hypothetical protein